MELGRRLLNLRKKSKLSQEEVARRLGVSRQTVSKWETNQSVPDIDKIIPICELYGVSADDLLRGTKLFETAAAIKKTTTKKPKKKTVKKKTTKESVASETKEVVKIVEKPVEEVKTETKEVVKIVEKPVIVEKQVFVKEDTFDESARARGITLGIFLLFLALIWLLLATALFKMNEVVAVIIFFLLLALGVCSIVYSSIIYKKKKKEEVEDNSLFKQIEQILCFVVFLIYLYISFKTMKWHITWLIWIIFALIMEIVKQIMKLWGDR